MDQPARCVRGENIPSEPRAVSISRDINTGKNQSDYTNSLKCLRMCCKCPQRTPNNVAYKSKPKDTHGKLLCNGSHI